MAASLLSLLVVLLALHLKQKSKEKKNCCLFAVVNAMSALLDEVDQELESRRKVLEVAEQVKQLPALPTSFSPFSFSFFYFYFFFVEAFFCSFIHFFTLTQ